MPVSANALTLAQYALMSNDPLAQKITYSLLINGSILNDIPLVNKKTLLANGVRFEGNLPTVNWGKLNTDPAVTSGTPSAFQEQAYLIRNAIDTDKYLVQEENQIRDPRAIQLEAYLLGLVYDMNDKFINNDPVTGNSDSITGLRYRIDNGGTYGVNSEMKLDFGGVDLSAPTAARANTFLEALQTLLDYMGAPDGDGVVIYVNDILKRKIETLIRTLGAGAGFATVTDAFGRSVSGYRNALIRDIGRKADQTTRIITATEDASGNNASSTYTSLYAVKYGEEAMLGWQFAPLAAEDIGLVGNGGTVYRTLIDYAFGLFPQHTRCIARGYDIKVA